MNKLLDSERFYMVTGTILIIAFLIGGMFVCDKLDQYKAEATVISVQALDEQIVMFETADGNLWEYSFNYDTEIKPQTKAILTFKEYENANTADDRIVSVKWVE